MILIGPASKYRQVRDKEFLEKEQRKLNVHRMPLAW